MTVKMKSIVNCEWRIGQQISSVIKPHRKAKEVGKLDLVFTLSLRIISRPLMLKTEIFSSRTIMNWKKL